MDLINKVWDYIENSDEFMTEYNIVEVYQIYQGNASDIVAECRIEDHEFMEYDAVITVSDYRLKVEKFDDAEEAQNHFVEYVDKCN